MTDAAAASSTRRDAIFYREEDVEDDVLVDQTIAVVGYGNLGRVMALNIRESGLNVLVGNRADEYGAAARDDGFDVREISDAVAAADIVYVLVPDEVIPGCFEDAVAPALGRGAAVCFASGYALAYKLIEPPPWVDVILLAPKMFGPEIRRAYLDGDGYASFVSVEQDATGQARERLLSLARSVGALRRGAMQLSASDEALLDLFVEQGFGAWVGVALQVAFHVGVEEGLPPEALAVELYQSGEMAQTFRYFADSGFLSSIGSHGFAALYGGFLRTLEIDGEALTRSFRNTLNEIRNGQFAERLQHELANGYPTAQLITPLISGDDPITAAEKRVRAGFGGDVRDK